MWTAIKGFEEAYSINEYGTIKSNLSGLELKPKIDKYGYCAVTLFKDKKRHYKTIHRLVAATFIKQIPSCNIVNHIDMNKQNNHYSNLEWTTVQGNTKHAFDNSEHFRGTQLCAALKGAEVTRKMIAVYHNGEYIKTYTGKKQCADSIGISEKTIYNRLNNRYSARNGYTFKEVIANVI